jgi:hypothetical protein
MQDSPDGQSNILLMADASRGFFLYTELGEDVGKRMCGAICILPAARTWMTDGTAFANRIAQLGEDTEWFRGGDQVGNQQRPP